MEKTFYDIDYTIGEVANAVHIHQRTLRIYDKEGLLNPKRSEKNRRLYSQENLKKLELLLFITRNLGVNVAGAKMLIKILEKNKIKENKYLNYLNDIALEVGISEKIQQQNYEKYSKKGRKRK